MNINIQKIADNKLIVKINPDELKNKISEILDVIGTDLTGYNYVSNSGLLDELTIRIVTDYIKNNYIDMVKDNEGTFVDILIGDKSMNIIISNLVDVSPEINGIEYGQILGDNV